VAWTGIRAATTVAGGGCWGRVLQEVLQEVDWISLEALSRRPDLDPLLNLLTLPIQPESELAISSR